MQFPCQLPVYPDRIFSRRKFVQRNIHLKGSQHLNADLLRVRHGIQVNFNPILLVRLRNLISQLMAGCRQHPGDIECFPALLKIPIHHIIAVRIHSSPISLPFYRWRLCFKRTACRQALFLAFPVQFPRRHQKHLEWKYQEWVFLQIMIGERSAATSLLSILPELRIESGMHAPNSMRSTTASRHRFFTLQPPFLFYAILRTKHLGWQYQEWVFLQIMLENDSAGILTSYQSKATPIMQSNLRIERHLGMHWRQPGTYPVAKHANKTDKMQYHFGQPSHRFFTLLEPPFLFYAILSRGNQKANQDV